MQTTTNIGFTFPVCLCGTMSQIPKKRVILITIFVRLPFVQVKVQNHGVKSESLSHNGQLKAPMDHAIEDIPTDKKKSEVPTGTPKYRSIKIKIIFVLILVGGFLLSLEEQVQTKILEMINTSSSKPSSFSLIIDYSKRDVYSAIQNKFSIIYLSGDRSIKNSYASR